MTNLRRRFASLLIANLSSIVGATVAVITLLTMLFSKGVRHWVKQHPYPIFWGLFAMTIVVITLLNYIQALRRTPISADAAGNPDSDLLGNFLAVLPPDGAVMKWLRQAFEPVTIPRTSLLALKEAASRLALYPIAYQNAVINKAYAQFNESLARFCEIVQNWVILDPRGELYNIPEEWQFENKSRYDAAKCEIQAAHDLLIELYDKFLQRCHDRGLGLPFAREHIT